MGATVSSIGGKEPTKEGQRTYRISRRSWLPGDRRCKRPRTEPGNRQITLERSLAEWQPGNSERYYDVVQAPRELTDDQELLIHMNGLVVVCISSNHAAASAPVSGVEWAVEEEGSLKGRKKQGALRVSYSTVLCRFRHKDGSTSTAIACVEGDLIEINRDLADHPELLREQPLWGGFIAIVRPHAKPGNKK